jgi:hypothetical protein
MLPAMPGLGRFRLACLRRIAIERGGGGECHAHLGLIAFREDEGVDEGA